MVCLLPMLSPIIVSFSPSASSKKAFKIRKNPPFLNIRNPFVDNEKRLMCTFALFKIGVI